MGIFGRCQVRRQANGKRETSCPEFAACAETLLDVKVRQATKARECQKGLIRRSLSSEAFCSSRELRSSP